ncbi:hypothetical protein ACFX1S_036149 [Malus domestica]
MDPSLYEATATGDVGFFEGHPTADLLQKTPKENNILHIAAEFKQIKFFKKVKKKSQITPVLGPPTRMAKLLYMLLRE